MSMSGSTAETRSADTAHSATPTGTSYQNSAQGQLGTAGVSISSMAKRYQTRVHHQALNSNVVSFIYFVDNVNKYNNKYFTDNLCMLDCIDVIFKTTD